MFGWGPIDSGTEPTVRPVRRWGRRGARAGCDTLASPPNHPSRPDNSPRAAKSIRLLKESDRASTRAPAERTGSRRPLIFPTPPSRGFRGPGRVSSRAWIKYLIVGADALRVRTSRNSVTGRTGRMAKVARMGDGAGASICREGRYHNHGTIDKTWTLFSVYTGDSERLPPPTRPEKHRHIFKRDILNAYLTGVTWKIYM